MAITGNLDVPGGRVFSYHPNGAVNGKFPISDAQMELTPMLTKEQRATLIGGDKYRLMGFPGYEAWAACFEKYHGFPAPYTHSISANEPIIYRDIVNGSPKRIRALISWASNVMVRTANSKLIHKALTSLQSGDVRCP